jgi:hypothetical protein
MEQSSQSQVLLERIFTHAYTMLRHGALEKQRNTTVIRKTKWAIHDHEKFMVLVAQLRGFNDSLESLFPGARLRMMEVMQRDIDEADQVLQL